MKYVVNIGFSAILTSYLVTLFVNASSFLLPLHLFNEGIYTYNFVSYECQLSYEFL